jgi:hypothetical protein
MLCAARMSVIVRWRMRDDKRGPRAIAYQLHLTLRRTRCSGGVSEGRPATYRRVRDFGGKLTPVARSVTATLTLGLSETYQSMIHMAAVFLPLSGSLKLRGELLLGVLGPTRCSEVEAARSCCRDTDTANRRSGSCTTSRALSFTCYHNTAHYAPIASRKICLHQMRPY